MALNIPAVIEILGQRFTVHVVADPVAALDPTDPETFQALGHCDRSRQRITLRGPDGLAEDAARAVLLHEVLHAIIGTGRIPPFHTDGGHGHDSEEIIVASLAPLLLDTLRDNPDLVRALLERDVDSTVVGYGETSDHEH